MDIEITEGQLRAKAEKWDNFPSTEVGTEIFGYLHEEHRRAMNVIKDRESTYEDTQFARGQIAIIEEFKEFIQSRPDGYLKQISDMQADRVRQQRAERTRRANPPESL